jgi:NTE family protein
MILHPKLGLVLGGGGARGGAHIGVLRILVEVGYAPDVVVGTSIGATIAALFGAGWSAEQMEEYFTHSDFSKMLYLNRTGQSLLGNEQLAAELERIFGKADLRELSPRVTMMTADIRSGQRVLLQEGPVVECALASMALPGLFPPVSWGEYLLVDGGITDNVPTQAAYQLGAQRVVAVDLGANPETGFEMDSDQGVSKYLRRTFYWLLGLANRQMAFDAFIRAQIVSSQTLVSYHLALFPPDILIRPDMPGIGLFSMEKISVAIRAGEVAAQQVRPRLQTLAKNPLPLPRSRRASSFVVAPPIPYRSKSGQS